MSTKAEYLKRYLDGTEERKKKRRVKKRINLAVHDDDIDWRTLIPVSAKERDQSDSDENDPDEAPLIAEFKDESVRKWQPLSNTNTLEEEKKGSARKRRMDSPDLSPPRRKMSDDLSPPHQRRSLSSDLSPPRRGDKGTRRTVDHSPPRQNVSVSSDLSPSRGGDSSPPRRRRSSSSNLSPPRRGTKSTRKMADHSPSHRKRSVSPDLSPPRRGNESNRHRERDISHSQRRQEKRAGGKKRRPLSPGIISTSHSKKLRRQNDDTERKLDNKQDLYSGTDIARKSINTSDAENGEGMPVSKTDDHENAQEPLLCGLDSTMSGRHAETVYRDKEGRRIDPKLERIKAEQEERRKEEENEKFMLWGRGIAQTKSTQERIADDLYEMSKPLARYADDEDLERMLKEREREGDPMLAFIRKKTEKVKQNTGEKPKKGKPTYKGSAPPNRFGIRPGYRWDGVDRSNGFEKAWFSRESNKKAFDEEAYKWSVEDM